jgi:hypothetical protein
MHLMLSRQVPEGLMEPYTASSFQEYSAIEAGTRYFTARRDDPQGAAIPFDSAVDPKGLLSSMANDRYFHGQDNKVLYYCLSRDSHQGQPDR